MRRLPMRADVHVGSGRGATRSSWWPRRTEAAPQGAEENGTMHCRPRLMPVRLPAPIGPNVFILGEPVLHHYYTVFDWSVPQIGFGLASTKRAEAPGVQPPGTLNPKGEPSKDVDVFL